MFQRDKNHASVIIGLVVMKSMLVKILLTWLITSVVLTILVQFTMKVVTWCREFDYITDIESRMYAKPADIEEYLTNNPQKPYISCE